MVGRTFTLHITDMRYGVLIERNIVFSPKLELKKSICHTYVLFGFKDRWLA